MTLLRNSSTEQTVQQFQAAERHSTKLTSELQAAEQENEKLKATTFQLITDRT